MAWVLTVIFNICAKICSWVRPRLIEEKVYHIVNDTLNGRKFIPDQIAGVYTKFSVTFEAPVSLRDFAEQLDGGMDIKHELPDRVITFFMDDE
jgi:hypothetical protein